MFEVPRNNPFTIQCTGLVARNPPESSLGCIFCPLLCESLIIALIWGVKSDSRTATTDHKPDLYSRSDESHEIRLLSKKMEGNSLSRLLGFASARLLSVSLWLISDQHILRLPSVVWGISFPIPREESRTDINFPGQANNDVLSWGVLR